MRSSPERAIEVSRQVLRRHRFRVERAQDRAALGARGARSRGWELIFHWALVLLLVGVIFGKGTGYAGNALIVEGQTWTNALINYDGQIRRGRFFSGDFNGVGIHLVDYEDGFGPTGIPRYFRSTVDLLDPRGDVVRTEVIGVNDPVSVEGLRITQNGFGWAPRIEIRDGPNLLSSSEVPFSQGPPLEGISKLAVPWQGFVKLPSRALLWRSSSLLWPDSRAFMASLETGRPYAMLREYRPLMTYTVWRGPLIDPSNSSLDTDPMRKTVTGVVGEGQTVNLLRGCLVDAGPLLEASGGRCPEGAVTEFTLAFPDLRNYSVLHVSRDPGVPIVLVAAILLCLGLLPAMYTSRRRVWVQVEPHGDGAVIESRGIRVQRRAQFEEEFSLLVEAVTSAAGGTLMCERPAVIAGRGGPGAPEGRAFRPRVPVARGTTLLRNDKGGAMQRSMTFGHIVAGAFALAACGGDSSATNTTGATLRRKAARGTRLRSRWARRVPTACTSGSVRTRLLRIGHLRRDERRSEGARVHRHPDRHRGG